MDRLAYLLAEQGLTVKEASERLGVCPNSCQIWLKEMELKAFGFNERRPRGRKS